MDRIDTSLLSSLTLTPAGKAGNTVGPRLVDPSPRLRMVDRKDTVELGAQNPSPSAVQNVAANPLVAGTVSTAAVAAPVAPATPAAKSVAANAAMRMYASPADQNSAASGLGPGLAGGRLTP
ncbi:MAG: hypothetical protein AAFO89_08885, partial [Planctomycetota bacterium]